MTKQTDGQKALGEYIDQLHTGQWGIDDLGSGTVFLDGYDLGAADARSKVLAKIRTEVTKKDSDAIWHSGYSSAACVLLDLLDQLEKDGE